MSRAQSRVWHEQGGGGTSGASDGSPKLLTWARGIGPFGIMLTGGKGRLGKGAPGSACGGSRPGGSSRMVGYSGWMGRQQGPHGAGGWGLGSWGPSAGSECREHGVGQGGWGLEAWRRAADEGRRSCCMICCSMKMGSGNGPCWSSPWEGCEADSEGSLLPAGGWTETGGMFGVSLMGMEFWALRRDFSDRAAGSVCDGDGVTPAMGQGSWLGQLQPPGRGAFLRASVRRDIQESEWSSCTPVPSVLFSMGGCNVLHSPAGRLACVSFCKKCPFCTD